MLVLDRRVGSSVVIGRGIRVTVRSVSGSRGVRLGIDAPRSIPVLREELLDGDAGGRARASGFRVLVVEDDLAHAELIELALQEAGIVDVRLVPSGEAAVAMLERGELDAATRPDLILLDLMLPGIGGLEVLQTLRQVLRHTPIVMLSCSAVDLQVTRCMDAGASAFLPKDANYLEFQESIEHIAEFWSRARRTA